MSMSPLCSMCIQLNLEKWLGLKPKIIHDVGKLWEKRADCNKFLVASNQLAKWS